MTIKCTHFAFLILITCCFALANHSLYGVSDSVEPKTAQECLDKMFNHELKQSGIRETDHGGYTTELKNGNLQLTLFKAPDPEKKMSWIAAVHSPELSLKNAANVSGPLGKFGLKDVLILMSDRVSVLNASDMPDLVRSIAEKHYLQLKDRTLKHGANFFANLPLASDQSGFLDLFEKVFVFKTTSVMISGGFDFDLVLNIVTGKTHASNNGGSGLNLSFRLPAPVIKGLESFVTLEDMDIHVQIPEGTGTIDPEFSGSTGITLKLPGHDFHIPSISFGKFCVNPEIGMPYLSFDGNADTILNTLISSLHIPGIKTEKLGFTFSLKKGSSKDRPCEVEIGVNGQLKMFGLDLKFLYSAGREGFELRIPEGFQLSQLLGSLPVPLLKDAAVKDIVYRNNSFSGILTAMNRKFTVALFNHGKDGKPGFAIELDSLAPSDFFSMAKGTVMDEFSLKDIVLVCLPPHSDPVELSPTQCGGIFKNLLKGKTAEFLDGTAIESGLTLMASSDLSTIRKLKSALDVLGIKADQVSVLGRYPSSENQGSFEIILPEVKLKYIPDFLEFGRTTFKAGMKDGKFSSSFDMPVKIHTSVTGNAHGTPSGSILTLDGGIDLGALTHGEVKLDLGPPAGSPGITWHSPFGVSWLGFEQVIPNISIDGKSVVVNLHGKFKNPENKRYEEVIIRLGEKNGKLEDYLISLPDSKLSLGVIPMLKNIPVIDRLSFSGVTVSKEFIQGSVSFKNIQTTATAFKADDGGWNIIAECDLDMKLGDIINLNSLPIKDIKLPNPRFFISSNGFTGKSSSIPTGVRLSGSGVAKPLKSGVDGIVQMAKGLNLMGVIDPEKLPASIRKGLKVIGITEKVEICGGISGIFGGTPSFSLSGPIPVPPVSMFKFFGKTHSSPNFFFSLDPELNVEFGYRSLTEIQEKSSGTLVFDVDFGLKLGAEPEVYVSAEMPKGTWKNPFGIKGFSLSDPYLKLGFVAEGEFELTIGGTSHFAGKDLLLIADAKFLLEASGLPDAVAFAGSLNSLSLADFLQAGNTCAVEKKKSINQKGLPIGNIGFKDIAFAFMTPGASLPPKYERQFHIEGSGVALAGKALLNGHELGSINGYSSSEGLYIDSIIDPFTLGPVHMDKSEFKVCAVTNPGTPPEVYLKGGVDLFGDRIDLKLVVEENDLEFETDLKIGKLVNIKLGAKSLHGFHFGPDNDFSMHADMNTDFIKEFQKLLTDKVSKGLNNLDSAYKNAIDDLTRKQNDLKAVKKKVDERQKEVDRAMDKLKKPFNDAVAKLDSLNREKSGFMHDYHYYKDKQKHCSRWRLDEKAEYEAKADWNWSKAQGLEAYIKTAEALVSSTKKAVTEAGKHTDPKLLELQAEYTTAEGAVTAAKTFLQGLDAANNGINKGVKALADGISPFDITSIRLGGSLSGFIGKGKDVPYLDMDLKVHGKKKSVRLSCNMKFLEHFGSQLAGKVEKAIEEEFNKLIEELATEAIEFYKK